MFPGSLSNGTLLLCHHHPPVTVLIPQSHQGKWRNFVAGGGGNAAEGGSTSLWFVTGLRERERDGLMILSVVVQPLHNIAGQ